MDSVDVPVVERREGILRPRRHRSHEDSVIGIAHEAVRHLLRLLAPCRFRAPLRRAPVKRQRPALEAGCLWQASEVYAPLEAWQALGRPTIAINANFFDVRGQKGGSWRDTKCSSPLGAYVDNTRGQGRANAAVTGTVAYAGKQGLSGGGENWSSLATMILPVGGAPHLVMPKGPNDYDSASPEIQKLLDQMYVFQGGSYTPDQIQDLFRGLGSDTAVLLDGGGSSSIVLRRDTGGMWSGAGVPKGSCDTQQVLCDSGERALPSWLAFA